MGSFWFILLLSLGFLALYSKRKDDYHTTTGLDVLDETTFGVDPNFDQRDATRLFTDNPLRNTFDPMNSGFYPTSLIDHSQPLVQQAGHWIHRDGSYLPKGGPLFWNRLTTMDHTGRENMHSALEQVVQRVQPQLERDGYKGRLTAHDLYINNPGPLGERRTMIEHGIMQSYAGVVLSTPTYIEVLV